jgi:rhamnose utilization protein RhaD (predicted bifunctional aldolase and dehydrogenase)/NAD(P)-dependent dehydrogenase (short-subunit alcohol dehydrogenase family)
MKEALKQLIDISRHYGKDARYVIAGGGNTSWKTAETLYVKASGTSLASIDEQGFVALDRKLLALMSEKKYSNEAAAREAEVKSDLLKSRLMPALNQRPSVEASVHNVIPHPYVVHLHPTIVNGLLCANDALKVVTEGFGDQAVYLPYITPGYILFKSIEEKTKEYHGTHGRYPNIYFLENHGIFVGADTTAAVEEIYKGVIATINGAVEQAPDTTESIVPENITEILPAIRAALSMDQLKVVRIRSNTLISSFIAEEAAFEAIAKPFTPDGIVYCNPYPLYIGAGDDPAAILSSFSEQLEQYRASNGYDPKVVLIKGYGMIAIADHEASAEVTLDVFEDVMKIAFYTSNFGGPHPMADEDIQFIEQWEVEAYRKSLLRSNNRKKASNKVAVVTGGAQGFGRGIVEGLLREGALVTIADINEEVGKETVETLRAEIPGASIQFVKTDITNSRDIEQLIYKTVGNYGGVDLLISNAGVLRAGSLGELSEEDFDLVTTVNYKAFYLCVKYFSEPMKLQHRYNPSMFMDIIQINSKSGLQGSNKNFAYAGGKFGGIGLTQSFALELIEYHIKVNAICPGNYFEGPLWADPENGLFMQYLRAGKVPGATTIEEVKKFYESKVPMGRGCYPEDVLNAIYYILDQHYETGQAIPVTGGQVMLN